ncbi:hypothetical protein [Hyperthermus butylicus]|uniref:Uncharacterized protein n=1 Tax=Hyperthermus butylicus (strain DSM 5456 / JCM 9403 / PLM1-5) TaxID=415426 RepID=A2BM89_HYPBU|nr:hypothetical protein [Hyperthermus butylicus]ABM81100.1 hypothetical protein Hbut_1268 [Hyperthermus butylicus DSM 5456]
MEMAELSRRIASAFKQLGGFIYQRDLDPPELVARIIRESGVGLVVLNTVVDTRLGIYVLTVNDRGCRSECSYSSGCDLDDRQCIENCVEECRKKLIERIVEALERYAAKRRG